MTQPIFVKAEFNDGSKIIVKYNKLPKRDKFNIVYWGPGPENIFERIRLNGRQDDENRAYRAYKMRSGTHDPSGITFTSTDEVPPKLAEKRDALRWMIHEAIKILPIQNLEEQVKKYVEGEQK